MIRTHLLPLTISTSDLSKHGRMKHYQGCANCVKKAIKNFTEIFVSDC